ncbi:MAG TPA: PEP-CTERM sorting domain-containing protein [Ramlibacter sp.]|nr:PEP-CTERM sorting domain-containing protein [Ramlibacter sp.]
MTSRLQPPHAAAMRGALRSIATAAVLATALFGATSAQASLVVTSAVRSVRAETTGSAVDKAAASTTVGPFNQEVQSQVAGNGPSAQASQDSLIDALTFTGTGSSALDLFDGRLGSAESVYLVFFTLTSSFSFEGSAVLGATGNAFSHASLVLEQLGAGGGVVESGLDTVLSLSGTLGPGDYSLVARADSSSIDPNEAGRADFSFRLDFTDLADPPAAVPEPQSLALALAGLLACGLARRRQ